MVVVVETPTQPMYFPFKVDCDRQTAPKEHADDEREQPQPEAVETAETEVEPVSSEESEELGAQTRNRFPTAGGANSGPSRGW